MIEVNLKKALLVLLCLLALSTGILACRQRGDAEVKQVVSSPTGAFHAVLLFRYGPATVGTRSFVAIVQNEPRLGDILRIEDVCYVFTAYLADAWKLTWEGESQLAIVVDVPLSKDYEKMIELRSCDGVKSRWYYEDRPALEGPR